MEEDVRVTAIRRDQKVGRGSCSSVDECWTDEELVKAMNEEGIDFANAVRWAQRLEKLYLEQGLNQRWGEDDDWELEEYRRFNDEENDKENR